MRILERLFRMRGEAVDRIVEKVIDKMPPDTLKELVLEILRRGVCINFHIRLEEGDIEGEAIVRTLKQRV